MATPDDPLANAIWNALHSGHQHLALTSGLATKYPANVAPFAALAEVSPTALHDLHSLLEPNEATYILAKLPPPSTDGLRYEATVPCLQMVFPQTAPLPTLSPNLHLSKLNCADASAMLALTDIAFPGFFRPRTCAMGNYYGIWDPTLPNRLIAMAGERLILAPYRELSGVCTHPDHRGQGYAAALMTQLLRDHRDEDHRTQNAISCLHVVSTNHPAIAIYHRLGFETLREVHLHRPLRTN
jgi:GNAT superfamily N-acetyltransferase